MFVGGKLQMVGSPKSRMAEKRQKIARRNRKFKLLFMCMFIAAISLTFFAGFDFNNFQFGENPLKQEKSSFSAKAEGAKDVSNLSGLSDLNKRTNIMLMGVDERKDDVGRSDTLMVMSLDSNKGKVSLLSIPRDTRVKIKRHGYDKINAAYAYGGEKLSQNTIESFLGINIDNYVIVNTDSFVKVVDAIGGIDINVEKRMYYEDPWDDNGGLVIDLKPGFQHMDGKTAVTYVRYRDEEGDAGRVRRQQNFMRACLDKLSSPSTIMNLPEIFREVNNIMHTDLSIGQMLAIAKTLKDVDENRDNLKTGIVPGRWLYIDGVSYLVPSIERLEEVVTVNLGINNANMDEHFDKIAYEYEDSVPYYDDYKNLDMYDENVNEGKDRKLIEYLNEKKFELTDNDV